MLVLAVTSRASCLRASPIKARSLRIDRGGGAANRPRRCRRQRFVDFLQNHDQIGNRPLGDRLTTQVEEAPLAGALAVTAARTDAAALVHGREWERPSRFRSFAISQSRWRQRSRRGRREEFKASYAELGADIPDPLAEETFRSAQLDWESRQTPAAANRLTLVRNLLAIRRQEIVLISWRPRSQRRNVTSRC